MPWLWYRAARELFSREKALSVALFIALCPSFFFIYRVFMPETVMLPMLGLGVLASPNFEIGFVLFATTLAVASLWHGYRHHRAYHAFLLLVPGLALLWAGIFVSALHHPIVAHAVTMSIGGTLVSLAHLLNMRLSRGHVHEHGHVRATE